MIAIFRKAEGQPLQSVPELGPDVWVLSESPESDELDRLSRELGIERDLLQDAVDPNEVPRVQEEHGIVYVFVRVPQGQGDKTVTVPALIALGPTFILTLWQQRPAFMEKYLSGQNKFTTQFRSQMLLRFIGEVYGAFGLSLTEIGRLVRGTLTESGRVENKDILRLLTFEGILNDFMAALVPLQTEFSELTSGKVIQTYPADKDLYEDVRLQGVQVNKSAGSLLKTTVNYRQAYSAIVNNNLNRVVKLLTAATVVLTFPMTVFSFYGMNVALPIDMHAYAWEIIAGGTTLFTLVIVIFFFRNRWL
ncbi:MAG TPA: magnesium transporter CorA family protein [Candidatus Paceibacterota bacterium]|nr:magnesium transporter CorA family protein [Candidatus Paceibacterota bacterium]